VRQQFMYRHFLQLGDPAQPRRQRFQRTGWAEASVAPGSRQLALEQAAPMLGQGHRVTSRFNELRYSESCAMAVP
jgi:hypothetical protein